MKIQHILAAGILAGAIALAPTNSQAQFGSLSKSLTGGGGDASVDGAGLLKKLTPGGIKFAQAYAKYYDGLGNADAAAKLNALADEIQKGGTLSKDQSKVMDNARKEITKTLKEKGGQDDAAKAKFKEGNALYREGLAEWAVVSAAVAMALQNDPSAALTKPELGLAAGMCVKGLKDLTGFLEIACAVSGEKKEVEKADK